MKNFSTKIACLSLSLFTIGAVAQSGSALTQKHLKRSALQAKVALHAKNFHSKTTKAPRLTGGPQSFNMDYTVDDAQLVGVNAYSVTGIMSGTNEYFIDQLNSAFTAADTNSPSVPRQNFDLVRNAIVMYDTAMDQNLNAYTPQAGTMVVDTIFAVVAFKNVSDTLDALVFNIDSVDPSGYPTTHVFNSDTVYISHDDTFLVNTPSGEEYIPWSGYSLDTLNTMLCVPNFTLPHNNTKFCVSMTFIGSKRDTFDFCFGFPFSTCDGFDYANTFTQVGDLYTSAYPRTINMNSVTTGWELYYGVPTNEPASDGTIFSDLSGGPNYEWNVCSDGTDTLFFYEQDIAMSASVQFTDVTGINNIAASGLSVGQNYPNPFNKETQINYSLTKSSDVTFSVYDVTGREILSNNYNIVAPGQHIINLDANTLSPGVYFYTFNVDGAKVTKRMIITE